MRAWLFTAAVMLAAAPVAHAQPADVPALTKMIETQPADMDKSTWKEKRRDAARKLVQSKDKRGVPVLIKLVETETFDIIGEIAIEGLGNMGDQSAVPALQRAASDMSRDKATRDLAKKALAKLGADAKVVATPTGACWRLVDCGRIPVDNDDPDRFDWGNCVDSIESLTSDRQHLVINCIAVSTCDELRTNDLCLDLGR